ncbi:16S rRNA (guanine(966)-N(2))-methyltransferase RsmD [Candidatus Marinamargulisbacteria bacterium SCGC AG-439-L15]|nr:16S rRNA (guanine(966)-N(2))-methyltransferase RsmD [Candidatus Marinamargulisbacteria bacterium SCGC AG-439-L15]
MYISAGKYKRRRLVHAKMKQCRPSKQIVRESIFSILGDTVLDATFLDLYCGTGALGIEALSRGAKRVVFVDKETSLVKKNTNGLLDDFEIVRLDVLIYLKRVKGPFDIIFMDPPWDCPELYKSTLNQLIEFGILSKTSYLIVEHYKKVDMSVLLPERANRVYQYGDTSITVFNS